jgi:hypothetical protein
MAKRESMLRPTMEKLGFTVPEVAALSSLGQTSIYKAIREGQLRIRKYGTRTIITRSIWRPSWKTCPMRPNGPSGDMPPKWTVRTLRQPSSASRFFRWPRREVSEGLHHDTPLP